MNPLIRPFQYDGGETGCLLLHGFTGSPSEMRPLGAYLRDRGYTVDCPLLPGHGTSIRDLERYRWQEWYTAAEAAFLRLQEKCDRVFVAGLSMGGVLALRLGAHRDPAGIAALASGVKLKDWRLKLLPLLHRFPFRVRKTRNAFARGENPVRFAYDHNSSIATWQLLKLYHDVHHNLSRITAPLLLINARHDRTVPHENQPLIAKKAGSEQKQCIMLDRMDHILTLCEEKERINREVYAFMEKHGGTGAGGKKPDSTGT